jgi:hypothetical protein
MLEMVQSSSCVACQGKRLYLGQRYNKKSDLELSVVLK